MPVQIPGGKVVIDEGRVVSEGTKDFLINDPISRQLYLGERFQM
jgi:lipopolysaccharide export system ATP-binding protein